MRKGGRRRWKLKSQVSTCTVDYAIPDPVERLLDDDQRCEGHGIDW
jgi:hypothetical protein